jgi:hypothetical protein
MAATIAAASHAAAMRPANLREALAALVRPADRGISGKVRVRLLPQAITSAFPSLPDNVNGGPGVYPAGDPLDPNAFAFIELRPFSEKKGGRLGAYRMGYWPAEFTRTPSVFYENPEGFIEVTRDNQFLQLSDHLTIADFITHDQDAVWPKYIVVREEVLDKLELLLMDLTAHGIAAKHPKVLSGFRTPYHNQFGLGAEPGATESRHQFGDAIDLIIDDNGDGHMDDLNRDGRVDTRDIDIVLDAVERVERRQAMLVGGVGRYHAMGPSGPFVHIDVRGYRARWGTDAPGQRVAASAGGAGTFSRPGDAGGHLLVPIGSCYATGASAVLCGRKP